MFRVIVRSRNVLFAGRKVFPSLTTRRMSSIGNPMFPHRPLPELETFAESIENSKKAKQGGGGGDPEKKGFIDILADHGGKIALVVFGGVVALFYTYYASGKDRNKLEESIDEASLVDPYEIQELRFTNKLARDDYISIVDQCKQNFHSGQATYAEFISFLRDKAVLPAVSSESSSGSSSFDTLSHSSFSLGSKVAPKLTNDQAAPRRLALKSTHLLDRLIMGYVQQKYSPGAVVSSSPSPSPSSSFSSSSGDGSSSGVTEGSVLGVPIRAVSWAAAPLDVDLLLVILNLTMLPDAEARVQALFELAKLYPESSPGLHTPLPALSGNDPADNDFSSGSNKPGDTLNQETVTRATVERVIRHLIQTDQIPAVKQTIESGVKYPIKLHRRKNEADMIDDYEVKKKLTNKIQNFDYEKFRAILLSYQVCAWGECYSKENR